MSCSEWIAPDRCGAGVCASKVSSAKRNLLFAVTAVHVHGVLNVAAPYWHYLQKSFGSYIVSALDVLFERVRGEESKALCVVELCDI